MCAWRIPADEEAPVYLSCVCRYAPPTYVYAARLHPASRHVFVAGGFDKRLTLWELQSKRMHRRSSAGHRDHAER